MRRTGVVVLVAVVSAGCSGGGDGAVDTATVIDTSGADEVDAPEPAGSVAGNGTSDASSIEEALAGAPVPDLVDDSADRPCERWGYACDALDVSDDVLTRTLAAMDTVAAAMDASDDAREQLRLGLVALGRVDGVGHVEVDLDHATMLSFTVDAGPKAAVLTVAGQLQEGDDVAPADESFVPPPGAPQAEPQGFAGTGFRGAIATAPQRYEPAGGPLKKRSAAIYNPFEWASAGAVAEFFDAEDDYTQVDVFTGPDVTPWAVAAAAGYDAVHIITHGGGTCPAWTNDRRECSSAFVGGSFTIESANALKAAAETSPAVDFFLCEVNGANHFCFNSNAFPSNPNGIVFFGSCGSDFGFNATGAGASVGWTGTSQQRVVERTAAKFWELMVADGVEFELAKEIVKGGGSDSHTSTFWASLGTVNMFTEAVFRGRNLRARDVIEMRLDGAEPTGEVLQFTGLPQDGRPELFPAKGQQITFDVEGVRTGSESGVTIEIRGDGTLWKSNVRLADDGSMVEEHDGYATWRVTLEPEKVEIPDVSWTDLAPSRAPVQLEIRAFERSSEYTAYRGTVRLGTDVEFSGPLPIFEQLQAGLPSNGELRGNDLRVQINTGTGELTGSMLVELYGSGRLVGTWKFDLTGSYDPDSGAVEGRVDGVAEGGIFDIRAGESGSGDFRGQADLPAKSIQIQLGIGGQTQVYNGVVVG